jgi:hypothetical protein
MLSTRQAFLMLLASRNLAGAYRPGLNLRGAKSALRTLTTAIGNTALGADALANVAAGDSNLAIGYQAGSALTSGHGIEVAAAPRLTFNEGHLPPAGHGDAQMLLELSQLAPATHDGAEGGVAHEWSEGGHRVATGRVLVRAHRRDEAKPLAVDGFDEPGWALLVTQGAPQLTHHLGDRLLVDRRVRPREIEQLILADEPPRVVSQVAEDREGLGAQRHPLGTAPEQLAIEVESKRWKVHRAPHGWLRTRSARSKANAGLGVPRGGPAAGGARACTVT